MRVSVRVEAVLLPQVVRHLLPAAVQVLDEGGVAVASINKDVLLYLVVALVCVVVQLAQSVLGLGIQVDVTLQGAFVVVQLGTYALCQHQTGVAVLCTVLGHNVCRYAVQVVYQAVISGYLALGLFQETGKRQLLAVEVVILLCGLVASVSQIEHVVLLL